MSGAPGLHFAFEFAERCGSGQPLNHFQIAGETFLVPEEIQPRQPGMFRMHAPYRHALHVFFRRTIGISAKALLKIHQLPFWLFFLFHDATSVPKLSPKINLILDARTKLTMKWLWLT